MMLAKHLGPLMSRDGSLVPVLRGVRVPGHRRHDRGGRHERRRRHADPVAGRRARTDPGQRRLAGTIDTGAWDALGEQGKAALFADASARNPARRIGTADDVAQVVLFALTTPFLTGATLPVDGGEALT